MVNKIKVIEYSGGQVYPSYQKQRYLAPQVKVAVDFIVVRVQDNARDDLL